MHGADDAYYERVRRWSDGSVYRAEIEAFGHWLAPCVGERFLDVGCGPGASLRWLQDRGASAIGVDVSEAWRRACAARPVVQADARALPFAAATFDGALLMHVFAHLADLSLALGEIRRVLVPGGRLGVVTPNRLFLRSIRLRPRWLTGYRPDATVERHVTLGELEAAVAAAGLAVERADRWGRRPWWTPLAHFRERLFLIARR